MAWTLLRVQGLSDRSGWCGGGQTGDSGHSVGTGQAREEGEGGLGSEGWGEEEGGTGTQPRPGDCLALLVSSVPWPPRQPSNCFLQ